MKSPKHYGREKAKLPPKRRGVKRRDQAEQSPAAVRSEVCRAVSPEEAREVTVPRALSPEVSMHAVHPHPVPGVCRTCAGTGAAPPVLRGPRPTWGAPARGWAVTVTSGPQDTAHRPSERAGVHTSPDRPGGKRTNPVWQHLRTRDHMIKCQNKKWR